jgi:hypothetical protein
MTQHSMVTFESPGKGAMWSGNCQGAALGRLPKTVRLFLCTRRTITVLSAVHCGAGVPALRIYAAQVTELWSWFLGGFLTTTGFQRTEMTYGVGDSEAREKQGPEASGFLPCEIKTFQPELTSKHQQRRQNQRRVGTSRL